MEVDEKKNKQFFRFDNIPYIIAMLTSASLASSMIYEVTFLHALGLKFSDVPITISDLSKQILNWLPLIFVVTISIMQIIFETKKRIVPNDESRLKYFTISSYLRHGIAFKLFSILLIVIWIIFGDGSFGMAIIGLALIAVDFIFFSEPIFSFDKDGKSSPVHIFCAIIAYVGILVGTAFSNAHLDLNHEQKNIITVNDKDIKAHLIKSYDSGFLIKVDKLQFLSKESVSRITYQERQDQHIGIACYLSNVLCDQSSKTPPSATKPPPAQSVKPQLTPLPAPPSHQSSSASASYPASAPLSGQH